MTAREKTDAAGPVASEGTAGSASAALQVGYAGAEKRMGVLVVGAWLRGEVQVVMSSSSGPKDYIKNLMAMVLESGISQGQGQPKLKIDEIRLLCGEYRTSIPFCVFRAAGRWFDCSGREVVFA